MRCCICDFSKNTPSEFYGGLQLSKSRYTRIRTDKKTGRFICGLCADDIEETHKDTVYRSQEELDWERGIPRVFPITNEDRMVFEVDD